MQLAYTWNDTFLNWDKNEYENISQVFVNVNIFKKKQNFSILSLKHLKFKTSKIWTPDLIISMSQ